jgi:hypothetical protein
VTSYVEVPVGELFDGRNGQAKFIRDYVDAHPGPYPVYSASLAEPFGHVDEFEYSGTYLTWVMNGYGGRVQEISDRFSANRDRGVFVPKRGVETPDLTYLRFAIEPQLVAAAVGRRVDGRLNEYTKIYPDTAESVVVSLPIVADGGYDYDRMAAIGGRLRRIEAAQRNVRLAHEPLAQATFALHVAEPAAVLSLGDEAFFSLSIGERVLRSERSVVGVPVYSANVHVPFGQLARSNLDDFTKPSLLWGIDGIFDWNLIPAGEAFATTDHCGRLQLVDERLDPEYAFAYLKATRSRYGFDRVFRASLRNIRADVELVVPLDPDGKPSLKRQGELAEEYWARKRAQGSALRALEDVMHARMSVRL